MNKNLTLSEYLYEEIKKNIINLNLLPGEKITEATIANEYNTSRTPAKKAFSMLEKEGLITIKPQIGSYVSYVDLSLIKNIMILREILENSIFLEVEKNITNDDIKLLKDNLEMQKKLTFSNDNFDIFNQLIDLDNDFHKLIFKIAHRDFLWEVISNQAPDYIRFRVLATSTHPNNFKSIINDHKLIIDSFEKKDVDLKSLYKRHIYGINESSIKNVSEKYPLFVIN
ncbi:MAG: GntR family transcriptional regulator [Mycoplasmatales bacterium]